MYISLTQGGESKAASCTISFFKLLPSVECVSPRQLQITTNLKGENVCLCQHPRQYAVCILLHNIANCVPMDEAMFQSPPYQRVYQYLHRHIAQKSLDKFSYQPGSVEGTTTKCLKVMLR